MTFYTKLDHRACIQISGIDRFDFLQGLVSNDVMKLKTAISPMAVWAGFLTAQGKLITDMFIVSLDDQSTDDASLLLDISSDVCADVFKKLTMFKLRSKVSFEKTGVDIYAAFGNLDDNVVGLNGLKAVADPRSNMMGVRIYGDINDIEGGLGNADIQKSGIEAYQHHRLTYCVTEPDFDCIREKSTLLESNFDRLNGVDFEKGCYMGQELTARMKYRALIRKRLHSFVMSPDNSDIDADMLVKGTKIYVVPDNKEEESGSASKKIEVGELRMIQSASGQAMGMALWRLDRLAPFFGFETADEMDAFLQSNQAGDQDAKADYVLKTSLGDVIFL